ncbi:class I SAM-dependent methyltransferase [Azospira sp. I13]|uniref:class I SAM-dependent methyltransferase n=1 Tax=Azospira sp. I13 TaxID=1765050 RepID=UPI001912305E|nr:class I SAM-dependent methyltransferase [Azospira sp. I13]
MADQLDITWGDPDTWTAQGLHWTHLSKVRERINYMVSGDPMVSPLAWFFRTVSAGQSLPLGRVLVLGCGSGSLERELAQAGWGREIVAIDLSAKVLEVARKAAQAEGLDAIHYLQADMNCLPVGRAPFLPGSFDAVLGVASVHHCANLEQLYRDIAVLLAPDGWFFMNEYVGPDQFQWPDEQMRHLNQISDLLPDHLMTVLDGGRKRNFRSPTVAEVVAIDPSEAICSSRLLPLIPAYFSSPLVKPYGGGILHMLLAGVAQNFLCEEAEPYLRSVMAAEDELYQTGQLNHDFACVIARSPARLPATSDRFVPS